LAAIRHNVARLNAATTAEVMAVVKGDGYGHGAVESARAALGGGASRLGVATIDEALQLRAAGITAPTLAWLVCPGMPRARALAADIELSAASPAELREVCDAAFVAGRPAGVHLKVDTGLGRGGARPERWLELVEAVAKAQSDGLVEVVGVWSHFVHTDRPHHPTNARQLAVFAEALDVVAATGLRPAVRHIANSAAALTLPASHFDLVRAGSAVYGLPPMPDRDFGLRPAMTVRARVAFAKRVPAGAGVSYGHTYVTREPTTLAVVPLGYGDGIPRVAGNAAHVWLGGARRTITGRVSMDQFVVDCGDDPVEPGDVVTLLGPGDMGEPTAEEWASILGTVSYEVVTNFGGRSRIRRTYG